MNFKEKILFLIFVIFVTSIWLTFGERIKKGSGWTIAVVMGTGAENQLRRFRNISNYFEYQNHLEALADLENKKVDAVIMDRLSALNRIKQLGQGDLEFAGEQLTHTKGRVAFRAEDDTFRFQFDQALQALIEDGTFERLSFDYFGIIPLENRSKTTKDSLKANDQSWVKIRGKGVIVFGIVLNNPPFSYYDQQNQLTGFEVELAKAICKQWGLECHLVDADWHGALEGLNDKSYDALWAGANGFQSFRAKVLFSEPYYYSGAQLVVKTGSQITGPESLDRALSTFDIIFRRRSFL